MQLHVDSNTEEEAATRRRRFLTRMNIFFFVIFIIFTLIIVRLAILQFIQGHDLRSQMMEIGKVRIEVAPVRGTIYDATGTKLASSLPTHSLYFKIETAYKTEEAKRIARELFEVFAKYGDPKKELTEKKILELMDIDSRINYGYVPRLIKIDLTKEEIAYFLEHRMSYPYIEIVEEGIRQYDERQIASQFIGYLRPFNSAKQSVEKYKLIEEEKPPAAPSYLEKEYVGFDGLELMYQDVLRGANGYKTYPINAEGKIIGPMTLTKPVRGQSIHLTLNKDVQLKSQKAIESHLQKLRSSNIKAEYAPNARTGYAVAMEVKTGNIVAMANVPDYDSNMWRSGRVVRSEDLKKVGSNIYNGSVREVYQDYGSVKENNVHPSSLVYLGSTMKPLTVLIGLQEGLISPYTTYMDIGYAQFGKKGNARVYNASRHAYGSMDAAKALSTSSNAFMIDKIGNPLYMQHGKEKGLEIWDSYMKAFGLGTSTGSGFPKESMGIRDYMQEQQSGQTALALASFGQQGKYTALQLAQYTATLANHGKRLKPQFVSKITDAEGKVVQEMKPEVLNEIYFKDEYWKVIEDGMSKVGVPAFDGFPYEVMRKTGTSEQDVPGPKKRVENAVFIAYAPAKNPVLAVAVVVPEGGYGAWGAAPIAREIFEAYDEHIGLTGKPQSGNGTSGTKATN